MMCADISVLIIDSDPPVDSNRSEPTLGTGERYRAALEACRSDLSVEIICPYGGDALPDLTPFDGVAFTGSGVEWSTEEPQAEPLRQAMRAVFTAGIPTFGSCNGMQLAATVLGGRCDASPNGREDGLAKDIAFTPEGAQHPMLKGRKAGYAVPCVHRDEVTRLPDGAVLLAGNAHSAVQAFAYEKGDVRFWGVQYHPEYSLPFIGERVKAWGRCSPDMADDLAQAATDPQAAARLGVRQADLQDTARLTELRNWLTSL